MLHQETVAAETLVLIRQLMQDKELENFKLVGGTALALQLGHRISVDIDLFTQLPFASTKIAEHLHQKFAAQIFRTSENSLRGEINGVLVDVMSHRYPDVKRPVTIDGIRMSSLDDIAAMKFNVITREPRRLKDYVDIYYLLEKRNLNDLTNAFLSKYPGVSRDMAHRSLLYHNEIDKNVPINLLKQDSFNWEVIKSRLEYAVINPHRIFMPQANKEALSKWEQWKAAGQQPASPRKRRKGKRL